MTQSREYNAMIPAMQQIHVCTSPADLARYHAWVKSQYSSSLWQSLAWRDYQHALGRTTKIYVAEDAGMIIASALIVIDRTTGGYSTWECPRGPVWASGQTSAISEQIDVLLQRIIEDAKKNRCLALYISPAKTLPTTHHPLLTSSRHEQPQATIMLDLRLSDEELLAQMHPKCRYNIKVAKRHGVEVRQSTDVDAFYTLMQTTAQRDAFTIGSKRRYSVFLDSLKDSFLLMAYHDGNPIAGVVGVRFADTGVYYYGASSSEHRHLMAPYLLQWEAIQLCKAHGCTRYDLLGIDPPGKTSAWVGVTEFKRKFGGIVVEYPQEQQIVLRPWVQRVLRLKRRIW